MKAILEGIFFAVGDEGISLEDLEKVLEIDQDKINKIIIELTNDYEQETRGIRLKKLGNKYKLVTKNEYKEYFQKLLEIDESKNLSQSALETLAIIAYNEPITRLQIDELRGVSSAHIVRKLVAKDFVKEIGRSEQAGRPILYGITDEFLDYFGLESASQLPKLEDVKDNFEDIDLYNSKYKEQEDIETL